jgi:hypothetical protein
MKTNSPASQFSASSDWYRVTPIFSVRFDLRAGGQLSIEWAPRAPSEREKPGVLEMYRRARDEFLADYAKRIGARVGCLELRA